MVFQSRPIWRWLRIAVVFGVVWLLLHAARSNVSSPLASTAPWASSSSPSAPDEHADICRPHGWKPFRPASPTSAPRKVYDLMMINTELDWLEIRLNSTFDVVDYFVVVEASKTFTGLDKPLVLRDNMARFAPYQSKMIYHEIEYPPGFAPRTTWDMEDLQRNSMLTQVFPRLQGDQAPNLGDVIVVSDVDEIPRPSTFELLRACRFPRRLTLRSRFYYYSFQWLHRGEDWAHPQATYYEGPGRTLLPNNLRIGDGGWPLLRELEKGELWNASWHCSSCFETMEELLTKMAAFSHTEMNEERFRDPKHIADRIRNGKDLWDREGELYDRVENNTDVPPFLLANRERFRYLLDRDGPTAGFTDYNEEAG